MFAWVLSERSADLNLPRRAFRLSSGGAFCIFIVDDQRKDPSALVRAAWTFAFWMIIKGSGDSLFIWSGAPSPTVTRGQP